MGNAYNGNQITWPPFDQWASGATVDSIDDNGDGTWTVHFTLNNGQVTSWTVDCGASEGSSETPTYRWSGYVCIIDETRVCVPEFYDLVIDTNENGALDDTNKVAIGHIIGETFTSTGTGSTATGTGTLTINAGAIIDKITAGVFASKDDLVGHPYYIIAARSLGGCYASDRVPSNPLAKVEYQSLATIGTTGNFFRHGGGGSSSSSTTDYSVIFDHTAEWQDEQWVGFEVLFYANGGEGSLTRKAITHNDGKHLYIHKTTYPNVGTVYAIVTAGAVTMPNGPQHDFLQWWYGPKNTVYSHSVSDSSEMGYAALAALGVPVVVDGDDNDPCSETVYAPGGSYNLLNSPDDVYDPANDCMCAQATLLYNVPAWKPLRTIQQDITQICGSFVPTDEDFDGATSINKYNTATLFCDASINCDSTSLTVVGTDVQFTVDAEFKDALVYFSVTNADGSLWSGSTSPGSGGVCSIGSWSSSSGGPPSPAGEAVQYSAGNTRYIPRWVLYFYPSSVVWIPDLDIGTGGSGDPIDPPHVKHDINDDGTVDPNVDCNGVGQFIQRPKSTAYAAYDGLGQLQENAGGPFVVGDLVRHVGDNQLSVPNQPVTGTNNDQLPPLVPYYDHFFRGTPSDKVQARHEASKSGKLLGTTKFSIATGNQWWNNGFNIGVTRTETRTATNSSNSSTTLDDSGKNTADPTQEHGCWFGRSGPFGGNWPLGWIIEIDKTYSGSDLVYTFASNKISSDSHQFGYADVGSTINVSGTGSWISGAYRIINYDSTGNGYINRSASTADASGGVWNATVTYKSPIVAFTDHAGPNGVSYTIQAIDGLTIASGDPYRIHETYIGDKWAERDLVLMFKGASSSSGGAANELVLPIIHNDNNTLFFAPQNHPIPLDVNWHIREKGYGGVWKYTGSSSSATPTDMWHVPPVPTSGGMSSSSGGSDGGQNEQPYQKKINETAVKRYGFSQAGDLLTPLIFEETYDLINLLQWTTVPISWTSRQNAPTPENNCYIISAGGCWGSEADCPSSQGNSDSFSDAMGAAVLDGQFYVSQAPDDPSEKDGQPPQQSLTYDVNEGWRSDTPNDWGSAYTVDGELGWSGTALYAYPYTSMQLAMTVVDCEIDVYAYAVIDAQNHNQGSTGLIKGYTYPPYSTESTNLSQYDYIFDATTAGLNYRAWASVGSISPSGSVGDRIVGEKVNDPSQILNYQPNLTEPQKPDYVGPEDPGPIDESYSYTLSESDVRGNVGFLVTNAIGIAKWSFAFVGS